MALKIDLQKQIVQRERAVLEQQELVNQLSDSLDLMQKRLANITEAEKTVSSAAKPQLADAKASVAAKLSLLQTQLRSQETVLTSLSAVLAKNVRDLLTATGPEEYEYYKLLRTTKELSDKYPFLLFPVRIETRFYNSGKYQLWIRVYPDTCNISVDRNYITDAELESLLLLINDNKDEVVSRHGNHRATFLKKWLDTYKNGVGFKDALVQRKATELKTKFKIRLVARKPFPVAELLPDKFVFRLYDPAGSVVGTYTGAPVPATVPTGFDETLASVQAAEWLHNFDKAVLNGMGIKIDLTADQYNNGFSKILVYGTRATTTAEQSRTQLENLLENHNCTPAGLSLIRQGTATNNGDDESSGYERDQETVLTGTQTALGANDETKVLTLNDGAWLSQFLGVDDALVQGFSNAGNTDQTDARRMNRALFPATLGYFLNEMMSPELTEAGIDEAEKFFNNYVLGRGHIPAIRIGKQPYGIMPASVFSRFKIKTDNEIRKKIQSVVQSVYPYWHTKAKDVLHISSAAPLSSEDFLKLLSLHPTSISYYQRFLEDISNKVNAANAANITMLPLINDAFIEALIFASESTRAKLSAVGLNPDLARPEIMYKLFDEEQSALSGPVIEAVQNAFGMTLEEVFSDTEYLTVNYLTWLSESDYDSVRKETGLKMTSRPLLFLLLKQAFQLKYAETGVKLKANAYKVSVEQVQQQLKDSQVVDRPSKSKHGLLLQADKKITGVDTMPLADFVNNQLKQPQPSGPNVLALRAYLQNLKSLDSLSKGKLERALTEHVDCCSYRLDAWIMGLYCHQLRTQRQQADKTWSKGIYLGAYGYLENIKPATGARSQGYILAPSQQHAATAAILRNAQRSYKENTANPYTINISAERVVMAKDLLTGVRNGLSLSQVVGYRFERLLSELGLQKFQYEFRALYPLNVHTTTAADTSAQTFVSKNRTVDGIKLYRDFETKGATMYNSLPAITAAEKAKFANLFLVLQNVMDALKDIMLAEGVYQMVQSNFERGAATLDSLTAAKSPVLPEVIQTPRTGKLLTHRVGLHLKIGAVKSHAKSLRANVDPSVNSWLSTTLGIDPALIVCQVCTLAQPAGIEISLKDLAIEPIDLLFWLGKQKGTAFPVLTEYITAWVIENKNSSITEIRFLKKSNSKQFSFFELSAILVPIRKMLLKSRKMTEQDWVYDTTATTVTKNTITAAQCSQLQNAHVLFKGFSVAALNQPEQQTLNTLLKNLAKTQQSCLLLHDARYSFATLINRLADFVYGTVTISQDEQASLAAEIQNLAAMIAADSATKATALQTLLTQYPAGSDFLQLQDAMAALLGEEQIFSAHTVIQKNTVEIAKAFADTSVLNFAKNKLGYPFPVHEWLGSIAKVREELSDLNQAASLLATAQAKDVFKITPMQFPYEMSDRWMAVQFMTADEQWTVKAKTLYTYIDSQSTKIGDTIAGFIIDEWTEEIPSKEETAGLAFHYNRPNAEAPQAMLLVTPPEIKGSWNMEDIPDSILSTIELSKIRAVEPEQLTDTPVGTFTPATVMYSALYDTTISTNFFENFKK